MSRDVGKKGGVHIVPRQMRKTHQKTQNPSETGLCLCSRQIKQPCSSVEKENVDGFAISSPKHSTGLTYDEALRVRELLEELPEILVPLLVRRTQHLQRREGPVKRGAARRAGTRSGEPGTPQSRSRGDQMHLESVRPAAPITARRWEGLGFRAGSERKRRT